MRPHRVITIVLLLGATVGVSGQTPADRDILAKINPSGRDINGDMLATTGDIGWGHTYIVGLNLVAFLPSTAAISQ